MMTDAQFIITLMKTETDALGFIPSTAIEPRWIRNGRFILQHNGYGRRVGYLLHGPPKPNRPLHVNQICIDVDDRLRRYAATAVQELLARADAAGATAIHLRCAIDLAANSFWTSLGFLPHHLSAGGKSRNRTIVHYRLELRPEKTTQIELSRQFRPHKANRSTPTNGRQKRLYAFSLGRDD